MADDTPNPFGLTLPLRIVQLEESVKVVDAGERIAAYVYVAPGRERQIQTKRVSPAEGLAAAKLIARALTDAITGGVR